MSPDEYEIVVATIVAGIRSAAPELSDMTLGSGRSNRLQGASGYKHQIDVSLSGEKLIYLIECKRWEDKIGVEEIMVLVARGTDIAQSHEGAPVHCVLASKKGATRGAVTLAKYFGVDLEIVLSALEFGMRIGKRVSVGMLERVSATDSVVGTVTSNGAVVP